MLRYNWERSERYQKKKNKEEEGRGGGRYKFLIPKVFSFFLSASYIRGECQSSSSDKRNGYKKHRVRMSARVTYQRQEKAFFIAPR